MYGKEEDFSFFHLHLLSPSKKTQETSRNLTQLHSKSMIPLHTHAKRAQEHNHHPKSSKNLRRNHEKNIGTPIATSRVATVTMGEIVFFSSFVKFKPSSVLYWVPQTS